MDLWQVKIRPGFLFLDNLKKLRHEGAENCPLSHLVTENRPLSHLNATAACVIIKCSLLLLI